MLNTSWYSYCVQATGWLVQATAVYTLAALVSADIYQISHMTTFNIERIRSAL